MTVDLLSGISPTELGTYYVSGGTVTFGDGTKFHSMCVGRDDNGDLCVRLETGIRFRFTRDGKAIDRPGYRGGIVAFDRGAQIGDLETQITP